MKTHMGNIFLPKKKVDHFKIFSVCPFETHQFYLEISSASTYPYFVYFFIKIIQLFTGNKMASGHDNSERYDDEIIADSDSDYTVSDNSSISDFSDAGDSDSDSDFPLVRRHARVNRLSSDSDSETESDSEWTDTDNSPVLEQFLGNPGLKITQNDSTNIMDSVRLFIEEDFFAHFVDESNKYHDQNSDRFKTSNKTRKWTNITIAEMKKFFGLTLMMGRVQKDRRDDYWTTDPGCITPIYNQAMSRDRYRQIWQSWHFSDNSRIISDGKLAKIKPILDYLSPKFLNVYKPKQQLSLDESIIPWRGRLAFRVYNPGKIIKYGILVRMVCEATSGYICNMQIYTAEGLSLIQTIETSLEPHSNKWHHVYMDNFYNSKSTTEKLLQKKIRTCGTIRINRGLPDVLKNCRLQTNETKFRRNTNGTMFQIWKTKRYVRMISNIHSADVIDTGRVIRRTGLPEKKPTCIIEYNKYMKGVDRADQYISYYKIMRKTVKWTKRVVMYLINCALFNAFRMYKINAQNKMKYKTFIYSVGKYWALEEPNFLSSTSASTPIAIGPQPSTSQGRQRRTNVQNNPLRLSKDFKAHKLENIVTSGKTKYPTRQCRVCSAHKNRAVTRYICAFCQVPLHKGECFSKYHSVVKY